MVKPQIKSKTNWFALLLALFAGALQNLPQLQGELSPTAYNYILFGVAVIVAVLRQVTSQPVR